MDEELREFMYLDSLSVQSLLASLDIAITEEELEVEEETNKKGSKGRFSGGINIPGFGNIGSKVDVSNSKTGTEMLETRKRINDQYLFSQLYDELESRDSITYLPDSRPENSGGNLSFDSGDIVEISGTAKTDPLYRMLNVASLFARVDELDINKDKIEEARKAIYGKQIGMVLDAEDDWGYAMSIEKKNLWIDDPQREFLGTHPYTVLGRVEEIIPPGKNWDYLDILRIAGTIISDDSLDSIRTVGEEFIEMIDGFEQDIPLPNLKGVTMEEMQSLENPPTRDSKISINIKDKNISIEGKALIVNPIAVYW